MSVNSRRKGKAAELEWVHWLRTKLGVKARRGQQYSGTPDSPDVESSIEGIHWEVKRRESEAPRKWMEQAFKDAGVDVPVVAFRRNRTEWLLCLRADDIERFAQRIVDR